MISDIHMALKMEGLPTSIEEIELLVDEYINLKYSYQCDSPNPKSLATIFFIVMLMISFIIVFYYSNA